MDESEITVKGLSRLLPILFLSLFLFGCAYDSEPVNSTRKTIKQYKVQRGETLYSIAWRYSLDYRQLAYWNKISAPFRIYPGQRIYLNPPPGYAYYPPARRVAQTPRQTSPVQRRPVPSLPRDVQEVRLPTQTPTTTPPKPAKPKVEWVANKNIRWLWPTQGRVIRRFSESQSGKQGVDIMGKPGQKVIASAGGKVVYSGNGLKGYGELVIIKHNDTFLSAYAHNRKRSVSEGSLVNAGQKIAELGQSGTSSPMLHFEIRQNGRPVDPLRYLPKIQR